MRRGNLGASASAAVNPALLDKAGACGTHVPLLFCHAWSMRTGSAYGAGSVVRQSSAKPRPCLRVLGRLLRGSKTTAKPLLGPEVGFGLEQFCCKGPQTFELSGRHRFSGDYPLERRVRQHEIPQLFCVLHSPVTHQRQRT